MTTPASRLEPDTLVEGKYRIRRLIAEGGMGAVYHAVQEPLGRDVAFKILKAQDDTADRRAHRERRFLREAAVSGKLAHPNTIVILDYGRLPDESGFFIVMEYLDGLSLRELLIERGSLGTRVTLHIAMQIASSLADAHRAGAVHRDLKPPNVMLVPRGEDPYFVKVVDFGLVKELEPEVGADELTAENHLVGSPMYMAPERFLSSTADTPTSDVYSLGIMIYEMLVGRPPFIREGDSTLQHVMMQHIQADPPSMHSLRPDLELHAGLEQLVMRCLAKDPDRRIQSMDALLTLLKACAAEIGMSVAAPVEDTGAFAFESPADETVIAPTPAYVEPLDVEPQPQPRQNWKPYVWGIVALGLLIVAIGLGVALTGRAPTHVVVNSNPAGALVLLGDQTLGVTPFDGPLDLDAPVTLKIEKEGYLAVEHRVLPKPGEEVAVTAELRLIDTQPPEVAREEPDVVAQQPDTVDTPDMAPPQPKEQPVKQVSPKKNNLGIKLAR